MFRVLLFALAIGITLYALLDWGFTSRRNTPGKLSRWVWLAVIVLIPILGPSAWTILRIVDRAEAKYAEPEPEAPLIAPDDDREFLDDVSRRIERRQRRTRPPMQDPSSTESDGDIQE